MTGSHWFLVACFVVFAIAARYRINQAFPRKGAGGLAESRGDESRAVIYSLSGAMLPWRKETASRHFVSYAMGIGYHAAVFLSFIWLVLVFFHVGLPQVLRTLSILLIALGALCGLGLLLKRILTPEMRYFSNPDDYFSNLIVTGFLVLTAMALRTEGLVPAYLIYSGVLYLYIPVGKLRHAIYFVLARVYLGLFYGRRGVWPAGSAESWRKRA
jgi:nitrate reductase gamma subunit